MKQCKGRGITLGGTARSPEDAFALYDQGLHFAEISIPHIPTFKQNIAAYALLLEKTDLFFLCHGPREGDPNDMTSLRGYYLPHVAEILQLIPSLKMPLLTLHLWLDRRFVKAHVIDYKIDLLGEIIEKATENGISVCLENLSEDCDDLAIAFNKIPLLNLTLDVGHAQLLRERNISFDLLQTFPKRIKHIHLHDNLGGDTPADDLHLPPGRGTVNFRNIFEALRMIGYTGTATLELSPDQMKASLYFIKTLLG